jgi:hypothetical protein
MAGEGLLWASKLLIEDALFAFSHCGPQRVIRRPLDKLNTLKVSLPFLFRGRLRCSLTSSILSCGNPRDIRHSA